MTHFYGIVVVYNKAVHDSVTYGCLKSYGNIQIIVCDNSTRPFDNKNQVLQDGYQYIDMRGNCGLSQAYNCALNLIQKRNPDMHGFVALFDDDTFIPQTYFEAVTAAIQENNADIFLPIVEDEIGILSPSIMKKYYCHRAPKDVWSIRPEELCGINSGMLIRLKLFHNYRYDEAIFLDYVDHNFLRDMRKLDKKIIIVNTRIRQSFSSNTDNKVKTLIRFRIFKKDIRQFYKNGFWNHVFFYYVIIRRKLQLTRKFRDVKILFQ